MRPLDTDRAKSARFGRVLLPAIPGVVGLAGVMLIGFVSTLQTRAQSPQTATAPLPSFDVASIKPNHSGTNDSSTRGAAGRYTAINHSIQSLIEFAYSVQGFQLLGGPSWINSDKYDVDAKVDDSRIEELQKLPRREQDEQLRLMLQSLLADRFKLKVSRATKELPVLALVIAKDGPKLKPTRLHLPVWIAPEIVAPALPAPGTPVGTSRHLKTHPWHTSRRVCRVNCTAWFWTGPG